MKRLRRLPDFVLLLLGLGLMYTVYAIPNTDWTPRVAPTRVPPTATPPNSHFLGKCLAIPKVDTSSATPEAVLPVRLGTPVPYSHTPITTSNVLSVTLLARWGVATTAKLDIAVNDIQLRDDGRLVAIAGDRGLRVREMSTGAITCQSIGIDKLVEIEFHPDKERIALKNATDDVQIWNLKIQNEPYSLSDTNRASALHFLSKDLLGMVDPFTRRHSMWELQANSARLSGEMAPRPVINVAILRTSTVEAHAWIGPATIAVSQFVNGATPVHHTIPHTMDEVHANFSQDGTYLAVGGNVGIQLWDVATGERVWATVEESPAVHEVQFSPNGEWIATITEDNALWLWNTEDGSLLVRLEGHAAPLTAVDIAAGASFIVTASEDGTVEVWGISDKASE